MKKLILVLPTIAIFMLAEVMLRSFHEVLPRAVSSYIASSYHIGPGGIYQYSPENHMYMMKPSFEREMYYNGYRWHHKTDSKGFRNPLEWDRADIVLLGDSMIYGHGVEEIHTVRSYLERSIGRSVVNMGMQGGSIHTEYQTFKDHVLRVSPQFVFLFFLSNDIADLGEQLTRDQMERFVSLQPGSANDDYFDPSPLPMWRRILATFEGVYLARTVFAAGRLLWDRSIAAAQAEERALPLKLQFHLKALTLINEIARKNGIGLVYVFIETGHGVFRNLEPVYKPILEKHAQHRGIPFLDLSGHFPADPQAKDSLFLAGDGHFSPAGAKWVARILEDYINAR